MRSPRLILIVLTSLCASACSDALSSREGPALRPPSAPPVNAGPGQVVIDEPTDSGAFATPPLGTGAATPGDAGVHDDGVQTAPGPAAQMPDAQAPDPAPTEAPRLLTLRYTPLDQQGTFSPRNAGAVWVVDSQGRFVKTLERFAAVVANRLVTWKAASAGNSVDAISAATAPNWRPHEATWNMTDVNQSVVPDGDYTFFIEVTDHNTTPGALTSFTIPKAAGPHTFVLPDAAFFVDITVEYP